MLTAKKLSDQLPEVLAAKLRDAFAAFHEIERRELLTHRANSNARSIAREQIKSLSPMMSEDLRVVLR